MKGTQVMKKRIVEVLVALVILVVLAAMSSCNVVRTITNRSEYYQKGDTSCTIVTKTIESYDATKK